MPEEISYGTLRSPYTVPVSDARQNLRQMVERVATTGTRALITRFDKPVAALVPVRDFLRLREADDELREHLDFDRSSDEELVDFLAEADEGTRTAAATTAENESDELAHALLALLADTAYWHKTAELLAERTADDLTATTLAADRQQLRDVVAERLKAHMEKAAASG